MRRTTVDLATAVLAHSKRFQPALALLMTLFAFPIVSYATFRLPTTTAATSCEVVSTGAYLCKIDGGCYLCDTKTSPDPNKNCIPSTSCAARTQWSTTPTPSKTLYLY